MVITIVKGKELIKQGLVAVPLHSKYSFKTSIHTHAIFSKRTCNFSSVVRGKKQAMHKLKSTLTAISRKLCLSIHLHIEKVVRLVSLRVFNAAWTDSTYFFKNSPSSAFILSYAGLTPIYHPLRTSSRWGIVYELPLRSFIIFSCWIW